jgi:GNAT superfamily N-acetyltransferase
MCVRLRGFPGGRAEMSELVRAVSFEEALRERCAERVVPFRFGRAVFNDTFRHVWELNVLRVDDPVGATVEALAGEAERVHSEAGHEHRRIAVRDESAGSRLEPGFRELGWNVDCYAFMAWREAGALPVPTADVEEVDARALRDVRHEISSGEPWAETEEIVQQVLDSGELIALMGNARHFAVVVDGETVSGADLYSDGRTAQVEDLATRPAFRGRGLATAVMLRAVEEALAAGHDFVFLIADDRDWPKEFYGRLGFGPLGRKWAFTKRHAPAGPA